MKRIWIVILTAVLIAACEGKPKNPVAEYGDAMINSYQKGKQAGEIGNLAAVKDALRTYHAANDKYPQSLEDIKPLIGSDIDFTKYDYNPEDGSLRLKNR
ncbi:MAG: hypothetical protein HZB33_00320 [Nitrospirae bacterium]|nr:hypothetical protein [Nitrospirota bacterium]